MVKYAEPGQSMISITPSVASSSTSVAAPAIAARFTCCQKTFKTTHLLTRHKNLQHDPPQFFCTRPGCDRTIRGFRRYDALLQHLRLPSHQLPLQEQQLGTPKPLLAMNTTKENILKHLGMKPDIYSLMKVSSA